MKAAAITLSLSLSLLAGCARSEEASLVPADGNEYGAVEQVRTPEADDQEPALGEWRQSVQEERPALEFGPAGAPPLFSMRCGDDRALLLQRHGAIPSGALPLLDVAAGGEVRRFPVAGTGGTIPMLRATVPADDPLIGRLIASVEPITLRLGDQPPLILPNDPAVAEFVRGCAGSQSLPAVEEAPPPAAKSAEPGITG